MLRLVLLLLLTAAAPVAASDLVRLRVEPATFTLDGPHAYRQLIVTGDYADGTARDVTAQVVYAVPPSVTVTTDGFVRPRADGVGVVTVQLHTHSARAAVTVQNASEERPVSFRREVVAALNVAGCNAGACHGTPSGKNGFKLSLRGFDPAADFLTLTRDVSGRRVNVQNPESSLILQKGAGRVPHEGGTRFVPDAIATQLVQRWLRGQAPNDPREPAAVARLEILPGTRVLRAPANGQQLAVIAHFADGSAQDVTRLTVFRSSDDAVAQVSAEGRVTFTKTGEVSILCRYLETMQGLRLTYVAPLPGYVWPNPPENNFVDQHLFAKLKLLALAPSDLCSDADFVRRASLDIAGVLPTPEQVQAFLTDHAADKRARWVDHLLTTPEYADFWALKWADILNNNRRQVQAKGAYLYHQWVRDHLVANTPFDQVVRELLTAQGSTFLRGPANYYRSDRKARDTDGLAQNTAQLFMGVRISCAKCHNHPFERWTQDDYHGLAAFFARVKAQPDPLHPRIYRFNAGALDITLANSGEVIHPRTNQPAPPRLPNGQVPTIAPGQDRREVLADWLTSTDNAFFARSAVNRIWHHLLGKGIVDPVDDMRDSNPPVSEELLTALAKDFVAHGFDVKHTIRTITASRVYQLSAAANRFNEHDERFFARAVVKMLPAEVMLDALSAATAVPETFAEELLDPLSRLPNGATLRAEAMPVGTRAVQLPDGDVFQHPFLLAFGQPARETSCECERQGEGSLQHTLQLLNGPTIKAKLTHADNRIARLVAGTPSDEAVLHALYLATLSRRPTDAERSATLRYVAAAAQRRAAWEDVQWALVTSKEFLYRH
jgi:hypothetical protein